MRTYSLIFALGLRVWESWQGVYDCWYMKLIESFYSVLSLEATDLTWTFSINDKSLLVKKTPPPHFIMPNSNSQERPHTTAKKHQSCPTSLCPPHPAVFVFVSLSLKSTFVFLFVFLPPKWKSRITRILVLFIFVKSAPTTELGAIKDSIKYCLRVHKLGK